MAEARSNQESKQAESEHLQRLAEGVIAEMVENDEEVTMYEKFVKVIDALEHCVKIDCNHCPYRGDDNGGWNCNEMQNDALELLKEQQEQIDFLTVESGSNAELAEGYAELLKAKDPVKPKIERALYDYQSWYYVCGACNRGIDIQDHFCRHCGRKIDHEREKT